MREGAGPGRRAAAFLVGAVVLEVAVVVVFLAAGPGSGRAIAGLREWITGFGPLAPALYAGAYAAATVLFVPGSALTIGAGVAFGLGRGVAVVFAGAMAGAAGAFLVARHLARGWVRRRLEGRAKLEALDRAVAREGWKIVALTRLSPVFPFNALNYAYGLTGIAFWSYLATSAVTILPGTFLYVYLGAAGASVAAAAGGAASWGKTSLQLLGLAATLGAALFVARLARRALREAAGEDIAAPEDAG